MNEQEKFEAWCATKLFPTSWREDTGANVSWLACAEQKDKEIAELRELLRRVTSEMTVGERYTNLGQEILDSL